MLDVEMEIEFHGDKPVVSSLVLAKKFGKRHDNVIQNILSEDIPDNFRLLNFQEANYLDKQGKQRPMYLVTFDGFILLTMGFTGKKAMEIKVKYITAFNQIYTMLKLHRGPIPSDSELLAWGQARLLGKEKRKTLTDAIRDCLIPHAIRSGSKNASKLYMTYSKMLNKLFLADPDFKIPKGDSPRDYISPEDLMLLSRLEGNLSKAIIKWCDEGVHYKEIYQRSKAALIETMKFLGVATPSLPKRGPTPKLLPPEKGAR